MKKLEKEGVQLSRNGWSFILVDKINEIVEWIDKDCDCLGCNTLPEEKECPVKYPHQHIGNEKCKNEPKHTLPEEKPQDYAKKCPYRIEDCPICYPVTDKEKCCVECACSKDCEDGQCKGYYADFECSCHNKKDKPLHDHPKNISMTTCRECYKEMIKQEKVDALIEKYKRYFFNSRWFGKDIKDMFSDFLNEYKQIK